MAILWLIQGSLRDFRRLCLSGFLSESQALLGVRTAHGSVGLSFSFCLFVFLSASISLWTAKWLLLRACTEAERERVLCPPNQTCLLLEEEASEWGRRAWFVCLRASAEVRERRKRRRRKTTEESVEKRGMDCGRKVQSFSSLAWTLEDLPKNTAHDEGDQNLLFFVFSIRPGVRAVGQEERAWRIFERPDRAER